MLPATALLALIIPTFAKRSIAGHFCIVLSAPDSGFFSFGLWVHPMFTTALPGVSLGFLSAVSGAVAILTGIQMAAFLRIHLLDMQRRIFTPAAKTKG